MLSVKRFPVLLVDFFLIAVAYAIAFLLRFDFKFSLLDDPEFLHIFYLVIIIKPIIFVISNMYRSLWSYASLQDALVIFKTVTLSSLAMVFGLLLTRQFEHFSRSVLAFDWILLFMLVTASRLIWRMVQENYLVPQTAGGKRTLIVGAGQAGSMLLKEIRKQAAPLYSVLGFVDDDTDKVGMRLNGAPVLGTTKELNILIEKQRIEKVIIAIPAIHGKTVREVIHSCQRADVKFKILPSLNELISGRVMVSQIKDVEIEDLLGRDPVTLDKQGIRGYLTEKKVLVTGAAGSIGSELCRQLAKFKPYKLILLDNAETPLFHIEKELTASHPDLKMIPVICDVRDRNRVDMVFDTLKPEVVFHAAAYKHVPMMEYNPAEAVANNVGGTKVLADAAHRIGVDNFVMISTDKAVNPTNVMGTTKRVAELYVQSMANRSKTKFTTVRFGNVLGSNGSVIPIFKEQIRNGGPVTVTDPNVIRYFMTIPEASQLVLQAGCIGNGGEIFVLDMGEPVRIAELAEELIRLSGLIPHEDIEIVYTGLRPGEKLYEELLIEGEGIKPTVHEKIKVLASIPANHETIAGEIDTMLRACRESDLGLLMLTLSRLVPEYTPTYHFNGNPPPIYLRARPDLFAAKARSAKDMLH